MIRKLLFTKARSGHDLAHELGLASYAFHQASRTSGAPESPEQAVNMQMWVPQVGVGPENLHFQPAPR